MDNPEKLRLNCPGGESVSPGLQRLVVCLKYQYNVTLHTAETFKCCVESFVAQEKEVAPIVFSQSEGQRKQVAIPTVDC